MNALILFTDDFEAYPIIETSFEGLNTRRCQSPISAWNAENIAITGNGVFDGSGDSWLWGNDWFCIIPLYTKGKEMVIALLFIRWRN